MSITWELDARIVEIALAEPFHIASKSWDATRSVICRVRFGDDWGVGEVSPDDRWGETPESVVDALNEVDLSALDDPFDLERGTALLPASGARCVLDLALHDLACRAAGITLRRYLGLGTAEPPETSMTIAITDPDAMREKALGLAGYPIVKTKVGFEGDVDAVAGIRDVYRGRLRIDANEGWSADEAVARLEAFAPYEVELCEQPIASGNLTALAEIRAHSPIPIYADEDVDTATDVAALAGVVDGVNLKLRKTGGIRGMVQAIHTARAHGMGVMIGCDLESGIATSAAAQVGALADFVDIDGPTLLLEDPFPIVGYETGKLVLPEGPGLGLEAMPW